MSIQNFIFEQFLRSTNVTQNEAENASKAIAIWYVDAKIGNAFLLEQGNLNLLIKKNESRIQVSNTPVEANRNGANITSEDAFNFIVNFDE